MKPELYVVTPGECPEPLSKRAGGAMSIEPSLRTEALARSESHPQSPDEMIDAILTQLEQGLDALERKLRG